MDSCRKKSLFDGIEFVLKSNGGLSFKFGKGGVLEMLVLSKVDLVNTRHAAGRANSAAAVIIRKSAIPQVADG